MDSNSRDFSDFCLATERLRIVPQSLKYLQSTHEYASDREAMRYMLFLPNDTLEETKNFLERSQAQWQEPGQREFECAILRDGVHIGGISVTLSCAPLFGQETVSAGSTVPSKENAPDQETLSAELGWCVKKTEQGHGYAREAAAALIQWTKQKFGVTRFIAHCDSENAASWITMERLGFKRVSCTGGRFNKLAPKEERKEFAYELNVADEWPMFSRFDMKNLPQVVEKVLPLWAPPSDDKAFAKMDVEFIVRNNIYRPELSFQLADKNRSPDNELLSAAFFTLKDDTNTARAWLEEKSRACSDEQKTSLKMVKAYLEYMDKKALSFMNDDDIKLSLYVSRKRGMGAALLSMLLPGLKAKGYKNLYLWTDSDCNWKWYVNHGYEIISQEVYAPFSRPGQDYMTFVFKRALF